ncbi:putative membrane protein [Enterobacter sp. J49]|uniref:hypothetical protein n=1 Tax=Enterobacter sp. J49 TaxID=1903627 RepID=UPI000A36DF80|nr:hypothetical protein [Enterobacter sp. J49]OUC36819.1 putative membrane protein [Enterobacter sp. J49]
MLNIVLFLVALLLVIVIVKLLKPGKRVAKIFASLIIAILVLCGVGYSILKYNESQDKAAYIEKLKVYSSKIDEYAKTHSYTVGDILADKSGKFDEETKNYFKSQVKTIEPTKKLTMIADVVAFANNYRSANGISTGQTYSDYYSRGKTTLHLNEPLKGQVDVVIVFYNYFIDSWDAVKLVENGMYEGWLFKIYNLDGTETYSLKKGWSPSTSHDYEMFGDAKGR